MLNSEWLTPNISNKLQRGSTTWQQRLLSLRCNNNQCVFTFLYGISTML